MPRLFIAIDFSDEIKSKLQYLRAPIPGARWVPKEQLHLTLAFLGEVESALIPGLINSLSEVRSLPFRLRYAGTGCFPDKKRPRVLWAGFEPQPLLQGLVSKVLTAVASYGVPLDSRPLVPHVTLARMKSPVVSESDVFILQPKIVLPIVEVHHFILFESRLTSAGAIHNVVKTFPLHD